jgi:hypothetical protein
MSTEPSVCKTPVAITHFVGFFHIENSKSVYCTFSLLTNDPEEPESMRPRYIVYFFEPFLSGIAIRIS